MHPSTICLALKNSPSIPLETRQRVQAVAAELGYSPNVGARNLALLRGNRQTGGSLPIAWMNQEPSRNHWRTDDEARGNFDYARRRATELGYHLEEIWAREPGMTTARLVRIIQARGIEGVIFPVHRAFDFSLLSPLWNDFALVGLNDHRAAEWIDLVCPDYYRNADTVFRQVRRLGFRRVGLALATQFDAATSGLVHGCFLRHQGDVAVAERIPVCFHAERPDTKQAEFEQWFHEHRPEVVVSADAELIRRARNLGFRALWVGLGGASFPFDGGIDEGAGEFAGAAVDCVVDKMRRFEKGVRESTRMHLVKSAWIEPRFQQLEIEPVVA
ncbi:MAG: hypothetical protein JWM35_2664 [Verrucomicrobia bacterium]|nr:hypothetical protein [Verrucomicrobiota bacterium]